MSTPSATEPRLHRLSVADYHRLGDVGVLGPEHRTELIEGVIIDMTPIGSRHAGAVDRLSACLAPVTGGLAILRVQGPVVLGDFSEPQPDLMLLRHRDDFYAARHPRPEEVLLVVEVSDASVRMDRDTKLPLYARHGVPVVWLVDLAAAMLEIHGNPGDGAYRAVKRLGPQNLAAVPVPGLPGATLDLTGLL